MKSGRWQVLVALTLAAAPMAHAADATATWPDRTRQDIGTVDEWMRGAYPGMVDAQRRGFASRWKAEVESAAARASAVRDVAGWRAVLKTLVNSTRDGHVYLQIDDLPGTLQWAGLALEQRGDVFLARVPTAAIEGVESRVPDGAQLLACDGEAAPAALARQLDKTVADWNIAAQRAMHASQWFVDDDNPFRTRPVACRFRSAEREFDVELTWTSVDAAKLKEALRPFQRVKRQREKVALEFAPDGGAWLVLGNLSDYPAWTNLIDEVQAQRERIAAAPYLVWDLRGNGGGDSSLAERLAQALWREAAVAPAPPPAAPKRWRVSPLTVEEMRMARDRMAASKSADPALLEMLQTLVPRMQAALDEGEPLLPEGEVAESVASAHRTPLVQPTYSLTDGGCFSSCIMTVYLLERLGARQAGDATGIHTQYGETWFTRELPSGLARLTLPLSINAYPEGELGGDAPDLPWLGASEDEAGVRAMIAQDAKRRHTRG